MSLFRMSEVLKKAQASPLYKSATKILTEDSLSFSEEKSYDIFLSHSFADADAIYGVKSLIEEMGYKVYVDWIEDSQLDRQKVTKQTAALIKARMSACRSLFFATSDTSPGSKWMPWELGYFDGLKSKVAILPVTKKEEKTDKGLSSGKFKIIHQIEQRLPLAPFDAEWEVLGRGKKRSLYLPFTKVEMAVPWVFFMLHVLVCYRYFPWLLIRECLVKSFSGS